MNNKFRKVVIVISQFLMVCCLLLFSHFSYALTVYYFASDFNGNNQSPAEVSAQPNFAPICDGVSGARLAGLDLIRAYAGVSSCPSTTATGQLAEEVEYIFLVDDTNDLSAYMTEQLQRQNVLRATPAGMAVEPSVLDFPSSDGRDGFKILVVGEQEFQQSGSDATQWLTQINGRFDANEIVAGTSSSDDDIFIAYHGSFYNKRLQLLENLSIEKIVEFFQSKQTQQTSGGAGAPAAPSTPTAPAPTTPGQPMNDYMTMCRQNSVPLPPTWDPTTNNWDRVGVQQQLFISANSTTEVWKYNSASPEGLCIALPRMMNGSDIEQNVQLLGIICQSATTGKACFWDNVRRPAATETDRRPGDGRDRYVGADTIGLEPVNMRDGYNLAENCTNCHRGDNVFLIHPNTATAGSPPNSVLPMPGTSHSAALYAPISGNPPSPNWSNPVISLTQAEENAISECTSCHEIPALSAEYCGLIDSALGRTMPPPPFDPADWSTAMYRDAVDFLANRCCALGVNVKSRASSRACLTP